MVTPLQLTLKLPLKLLTGVLMLAGTGGGRSTPVLAVLLHGPQLDVPHA
jgi:hypothetical protein